MRERSLPWLVAAGLVWTVCGLHFDGWAHAHGHAEHGPFTVYHAIFYSGFLFTACVLTSSWLAGRRAGRDRRTALPPGYRITFAACFVFVLGGSADLLWHLAFGIEGTFAALLSPTHLVVYSSIVAMAFGALSASWRSDRKTATWPDILVATMLLSMFTFWSLFDNLWTNRYASGSRPDLLISQNPNLLEELGVFSVVWHSAAIAGVLLSLIRRFRLPRGACTVLLGVNGVLLVSVQSFGSAFTVLPLCAGIVADVLYARWRPALARPLRLRAFAFAVPFVLYGMYFLVIRLRYDIWWQIHIWVGSIVMAGGVGVLVSFLVAPTTAASVEDPFA
jgi:hypothetical protein